MVRSTHCLFHDNGDEGGEGRRRVESSSTVSSCTSRSNSGDPVWVRGDRDVRKTEAVICVYLFFLSGLPSEEIAQHRSLLDSNLANPTKKNCKTHVVPGHTSLSLRRESLRDSAAMTSLARQLERLAIPGQPSLRQLVSKKRPSLLFDRREAADMDADTFFSLGRNGLEELIGIDHTFSQFEDSLFTESSKEFERSVQTPDVLVELDRNLSVFLRRISPYLLLKPAQKCLEWLVHAYRVHSCNVDTVVECVLPYYETKLFARVVQLLPLKSPSSRWHWLRPLQKAGSPLSRLSLVQHCLSDLSFLVFVCEMVPRAVAVHKRSPPGSSRSVLALYCSTVITVLESEGGTDEEVVGRLLPYLLKGLKSRVVEYRAASYMIAGQLVSKASLERRVSTALLDAITKVTNVCVKS